MITTSLATICHYTKYIVHYSVIDYIPYAVYYISWLIYFVTGSLYLLIFLTYFPHLHISHLPDNHQFVLRIYEKKHTGPANCSLLAQIPSWTFAFLVEDTLISHSYPTLGTTVSGCLRSCVIRCYITQTQVCHHLTNCPFWILPAVCTDSDFRFFWPQGTWNLRDLLNTQKESQGHSLTRSGTRNPFKGLIKERILPAEIKS